MAPRKARNTTASKSKTARKSSAHDDSPVVTFAAELVKTLKRHGVMALSNGALKDIRSELRGREYKISLEIVENIVVSIDQNGNAFSNLCPTTFTAVVEILLEAEDCQHKERGLFVLAASLHKESQNLGTITKFQDDLSLIGQECLHQVYSSFCDKKQKYNIRRWTGILALELIANSDKNKELVELMPENKRRNLGSAILYESNEILRTIAGRILTALVASDIPTNNFFPEDSDKELSALYPQSTPSVSQWDKNFQSYIDDIWSKIEDSDENQGQIYFAQNVATIPEHLNTKNVPTRDRSIYVAFLDCVYIYLHSDRGFDAAIDIPYALISEIQVGNTPLDSAAKVEPADVVLLLRQIEDQHTYINSSISKLSTVRITVQNRSIAEEISETLQGHVMRSFSVKTTDESTDHVTRKISGVDSQSSIKSKVSTIDHTVVFNGDYGIVITEGADCRVHGATVMEDQTEGMEPVKAPRKITSGLTRMTEVRIKNNGKEEFASVSPDTTIFSQVENDGPDLYNATPRASQAKTRNQAESAGVDGSRVATARRHPAVDSDLILKPRDKNPRNVSVESNSKGKQPITFSNSHEVDITISGYDEDIIAPSRKKADNLLPAVQSESQLKQSPRILPEKRPHAMPKRVLKGKRPLSAPKSTLLKAIHVPKPANPGPQVEDLIFSPTRETVTGARQVKSKKILKTYGKSRASAGAILDRHVDADIASSSAKEKTEQAYKRRSAPGALDTSISNLCTTRAAANRARKKIREMSVSENEDEVDELGIKAVAKSRPRKNPPARKKGQQATNKDNKSKATTAPVKELLEISITSKTSHVGENQAPRGTEIEANEKSKDNMASLAQAIDLASHEQTNHHTTFFEDGTMFQNYESTNLEDQIPSVVVPNIVKRTSPLAQMAGQLVEHFDNMDGLPKANKKSRFDGNNTTTSVAFSTFKPKIELRHSPRNKSKALQSLANAIHTSAIGSDGGSVVSEIIEPLKEIKDTATVPTKSKTKLKRPCRPNYAQSPSKDLKSKQITAEPPESKPLKRQTKNCVVYKPSTDLPSRRHRIDEESPANSVAATHTSAREIVADKRVSTKRLPIQRRKQSTPPTRQSPRLAAQTLAISSSALKEPDLLRANLIDDHLARKTPLVAFDKDGPRNQGLSSIRRLNNASRTDLRVQSSLDTNQFLSKKRIREDNESEKLSAAPPKRPRMPKFTDDIAKDDAVDEHFYVQYSSSLPPQQEPDLNAVSSQSRVDENGSPRLRATLKQQSESLRHVKKRILSSSLAEPKAKNIQVTAIDQEFLNFDDSAMLPILDNSPFSEDNRVKFSSNRKAGPSVQNEKIDFRIGYAPYSADTHGEYVDLVNEKVATSAKELMDPFIEPKQRQESDFARRLRREGISKNEIARATGSPDLDLLAKAPVRKSSIRLPEPAVAFDPEKTLVDVENQHPYEHSKSPGDMSSSNSSIFDDRSCIGANDDIQEPTPEEQWREALKPHQKGLNDIIRYIVDTFLRQLFNKESTTEDVVNDYLNNATKIVESLGKKMKADRCAIQSETSKTMKELVDDFRSSTNIITNLENWGDLALDENYESWRRRQHALQQLSNMPLETMVDGE